MGNCCRPASSMDWDGEDWSSLTSKKTCSSKVFDKAHGHRSQSHALCLGKAQKETLLGALRVSPDSIGKVTIKISKSELAQLLELEKQKQVNNKKQVGRASPEQVLLRLINARDHDSRHRSFWRPVLESIPEVIVDS